MLVREFLDRFVRVQTPIAILALGLGMVLNSGSGYAQRARDVSPIGVSSDAFLNGLPAGSIFAQEPTPAFPQRAIDAQSSGLSKAASQASFLPETVTPATTPSVTTAQFEIPTVPNVGPTNSSMTVGTGVAPPIEPHWGSDSSALPVQAPAKKLGWRDRLGLESSNSNFLVGYEAIGFRRSNDSIGPYSQGDGLSRFDQDIAGRYTISRLMGGIDRIEFKFTGPFSWDRSSRTMGPLDSNLPVSIASSFNNADVHHQSHQVRLSSYELNRSWTGDELSAMHYGLRILDHKESFQLDSTRSGTESDFSIATQNFLVGGQYGLSLYKPLSQRLSAGFGGGAGLYGNFASASLHANEGVSSLWNSNENTFRICSMWEWNGRVQYQISKNIVACGGYEWWYFPNLATSADQRLPFQTQLSTFEMRNGDDQLFRGWSIGLSGRF